MKTVGQTWWHTRDDEAWVQGQPGLQDSKNKQTHFFPKSSAYQEEINVYFVLEGSHYIFTELHYDRK